MVGSGTGHDVKGSTFCEYYNETTCTESQQACSERETCSAPDPGKRNHCYVLWKYDNATNKSTIKLKVKKLLFISVFFEIA